jgi:ribonucleoside-diphosphate reductase alpha chain
LVQLKIVYGSEKSYEVADNLMGFIQREAHKKSTQLAEEKGVFPNYGGSKYDGKYKIRNATLTSIAPTGTLSIIAGCTSSIETIFAVVLQREILDGQIFFDTNPYFEKIAKEEGFYSTDLMEKIANRGTLKGIPEIPKEISDIFVTALEVSPEAHVRMQAVFQQHVDNAVSKTVNLPNAASVEEVKNIFLLAYKLGCKGITVYRDGSKEHQVLSIGRGEKSKGEERLFEEESCPQCGKNSLIQHARCSYCKNCGASACSL